MIRAVIYDHDGTLVNSLPMVVAATNRVLVANGFAEEPPAVVIAGMVLATGPRMGHHARTLDPGVQSRLAAKFYAAARELGPVHARAYDGIPYIPRVGDKFTPPLISPEKPTGLFRALDKPSSHGASGRKYSSVVSRPA